MTTANATDVQNRLKAALACLNLSLEAELTQYRCHRMVTGAPPFGGEDEHQSTAEPEDDFPEFAELAAMTDAAAVHSQTSFAITPVVSAPEPTTPNPMVQNPMDPTATEMSPIPPSLPVSTPESYPHATSNHDASNKEDDSHEFEVDDFSFDAAELAGLLPQAFAHAHGTNAANSGTNASGEVLPTTAVKRPMASTRELLKNVQGGDRHPGGINHVQRWLMVVGVLGGLAAALGVYMLLRGDRSLPEQPDALSSEVSQPQANSPSQSNISGSASRSSEAIPGGPDLTAREFTEVNPKTLSQLKPTPAATNSPSDPTVPAKPENESASPRTSNTSNTRDNNASLDMSILQMPNGHYYIVAPYNNPEDLEHAQTLVPEAFLIRLAEGLKIQLAVFEDEPSAKTWVAQME
ncbi:hypothetical protein L3556_13990 [Candidatus Synechococcus calcipolaris G9]|uniref:SPOR domain-containing protein n=1 Tax=Candidatus Synechococcus calcipolaris G9 TaxID=1497997 RepID=A0ABT6F2J0_9SYNE|nr:hypothetical protein [Candidatus Synechococcus calcipolaris]MDG2992032.1 hypothetical protein [Candidatus Synechococcus calcipolaris G9]